MSKKIRISYLLDKSKLNEVKNLGFLNSVLIRKGELIQLQAKLHGMLNSGEKSNEIYRELYLLLEMW